MKLNEFFTYGADGFEQDKTYEPEDTYVEPHAEPPVVPVPTRD